MANLPSYMHIRKYIIDMVFEHNDSDVRIMSERELSAKFKVSRTTVRNALRDLVNDGCIYNKPGRGMFIRATNRKNDSFSLLKSYKVIILIDTAKYSSIDGFSMKLLNGIFSVFASLPVKVQIVNVVGDDMVSELTVNRPDGIIWIRPPRSVLKVLKKLRREVPVYTIGDVVKGNPCNITLDYALAGKQLAAYFLDAGCRNVIFSGYEDSGVRYEVYRGWAGEFASRGLVYERMLRIDTSENITEKICSLFEKRAVDGIFSFGTEAAAGDRALSLLPENAVKNCVFVTDDTPFALYAVKHRPEAEVLLSPLQTAKLCAENLYRLLTDPAFVPEELVLKPEILRR